ncbi:MAG: hypothetical protein V2I36_18295 [Desulfopila sp.]|jgi:hypothetical protein|nr:hypothetical protein [Desulfopila sp.]
MRLFAIFTLVLGIFFSLASAGMAADKVVVVPINSSKVVPQLQPIAQGSFSSSCQDFYSYGVDSCTVSATGKYIFTLTKSFTGYANIIATAYNEFPAAEIATASSTNGGNTITIYIANGEGAAIHSDFQFVVYANVQ